MRAAPFVKIALAAVLLFGGAWYLSTKRGTDPAASTGKRAPFHPAVRPRQDKEVQSTLEGVEELRKLRKDPVIGMGGPGHPEYSKALQKVRQDAPEMLHYLEEIVLDRQENLSLRVDLLNVIAADKSKETGRFLAAVVADPGEASALRIAALYPLMDHFKDAETFAVFKETFESPVPFEGRYHLCLALAENGNPGAVPILLGALEPDRPMDVRCHAAIGLGKFARDPAVRDELKRRVTADPLPDVRRNALRSLSKDWTPETEEFMKDIASRSDIDEETRRVAGAFVQQGGSAP